VHWTAKDQMRANKDGWRMAPFPHPRPIYDEHGMGVRFSSTWELENWIAESANTDEWYFDILMSQNFDHYAVRATYRMLGNPNEEQLLSLAESGNALARRIVVKRAQKKLRGE